MIVQRAYVYRLEPTPEQEAFLDQTAGACRALYNLALEQRRDWRSGMNEDNICDIAGAEREIIPGRRKLGCDEIAWISAALDRFAAVARNRNIYSERSMKGAKLACLLEIMDVAGCEFEDDVARHNALSDFPELCPDKPLMNKTQ